MSLAENHVEGLHRRTYVAACALCRSRERLHLSGPTLFDPKGAPPPPKRVGAGADTLLARFERFYAAQPAIWTRFEAIALQLLNAGNCGLGAKQVWEVIRRQDETTAGGTRSDGFKLPNDFPPYFARVFLSKHPSTWRSLAVRRVQGDPVELAEVLERCLDRVGVLHQPCSRWTSPGLMPIRKMPEGEATRKQCPNPVPVDDLVGTCAQCRRKTK